MAENKRANQANVWPVGTAKLVRSVEEVPTPRKFVGAILGYYFYKTRHGEYAIAI